MEKLIADELDLASGRVTIRVLMDEAAYFEVLSDISGLPVRDEYSLFKILKESAGMKEEYEKVRNAWWRCARRATESSCRIRRRSP